VSEIPKLHEGVRLTSDHDYLNRNLRSKARSRYQCSVRVFQPGCKGLHTRFTLFHLIRKASSQPHPSAQSPVSQPENASRFCCILFPGLQRRGVFAGETAE
jgi:hypothetical protein